MSSKLDVRRIIKDHIKTLIDYRTEEPSGADWLVFYGLPFVGAAIMVWCGIRLNSSQTTVLITALSIFAALLFNLLLLTHNIIADWKGSEKEIPRGERRLREIYANISYSILVSVLAIGVLIINAVFNGRIILSIASALVYFLVANFLLTLFLVLKRIHLLLGEEFE